MALDRKQQFDFIARLAPAAQASQEKYGVPASITLAQAILESAWGLSKLAQTANNYFGIKARQGEEYCEFPTPHDVKKVSDFRKFPSLNACFDRHGQLLSTLGRYRGAMARAADPLAFAIELQCGGYSENPKYPTLLAQLMEEFDLEKYDRGATAP